MLRRDQVEALLQEATDQEVCSPPEMLLTHDEIEGALPVTFHAVRELCRGYLAWLDVQPRPISEAPKGERLLCFGTERGKRWIMDGIVYEKGFVGGSAVSKEPEHFIPLSALPTPDKVTI